MMGKVDGWDDSSPVVLVVVCSRAIFLVVGRIKWMVYSICMSLYEIDVGYDDGNVL